MAIINSSVIVADEIIEVLLLLRLIVPTSQYFRKMTGLLDSIKLCPRLGLLLQMFGTRGTSR